MTKYLKELAKKINTNEYTTNQRLAEILQDLKQALLTGKYYTRVNTVSRSGMSRTMEIAYIKDNRLCHVNNTDILAIAGIDKSGRITGCGMDMMFAAQYNLFTTLCPKHRYQDRMQRYNYL